MMMRALISMVPARVRDVAAALAGPLRAGVALLLLAASSGLRADEEVLWWRVYGEESVDWYGSDITVNQLAAMKDNELYARVSVRDSSGSSLGYLNLYMMVDGEVFPSQDEGPMSSVSIPPANAFADLGDYGAAGYSFAIELGNEIDSQWTAYVVSEVRPYGSLGANITDWRPGHVAIPEGEWIPRSFVVPEPCSGLLLLMGGGLLALRRRRRV